MLATNKKKHGTLGVSNDRGDSHEHVSCGVSTKGLRTLTVQFDV